MNAMDFSQFKVDPPSEFADALYRRLQRRPVPLASARSMLQDPVGRLRVGLVLVGSILIVGACVRQVLAPRQVQVGALWVYELSEAFVCAGDNVYPSYAPSRPMPSPQPAPTQPPRVSLQELRQLVGFPLRVPTWAPEGFALQKDYPAPRPYAFHSINWLGPQGTGIAMLAFPPDMFPTREIRVLRGAWEEAVVLGEPAVVVHGQCRNVGGRALGSAQAAAELSWDDSVARLAWAEEGVFYELLSTDADVEALVRMAESTR